MRNKKDKNWFYRTETGRWITACIVAAMTLVVVFLIEHPVFMTIDDGRLKYVFAGYSSGSPESSYLFSYYPLSAILAALYTYFPNFHWYGFYQYGVIGLSSLLIGKTIYKIAYKKKIRFLVAILCQIWTYVTTALISTLLMHFEITAAMAGTAGVMLLMGLDIKKDNLGQIIIDFVFSVLCIAASYVIQFNAFYAACCYLMVAFAFHFLSGIKKDNLKKILLHLVCYLLCVALTITGIIVLEDMAKDTPQWDEYMQYNKYRVSFWDYPHIGYDDDPALFEQMGWSEEFYDLTQSMYFMDERFNKENLAMFTQRFSWFDFESLNAMKTTFVKTLSGLYESESLVTVQTVVLTAFTLYFLLALTDKKKRARYYPHIISAICCIGGTALVLMFLAAKGRLPLRAWLACSIPCISVVMLLYLMMRYVPTKDKKTRFGKRLASIAILTAWMLGCVWTYGDIIRNDMRWRVSHTNGAMLMEEYAMDNPDNVYVYDLMGAQNYGVFSIYPDVNLRPTNAFVWGSSYLFTPVYENQLALNGMDSLTTEDLFEENVYFIGHISGSYSKQLYAMLQAEYESVEMLPVAQIDNVFVVYKIRKA